MSATRECRRKHWRVWTTKTLGDGRQLVVCPLCGYEPAPSDIAKRAER
jgi:hypothetical protein